GGKRGSLNSRGATSSIKSLPVEYRDVLQRYLSGQINLPEQTFERQKVLDRIIDQLTKRGISSQHIEMRFREWQRKVEKSANTNRT
ncbi:MAG: hypothetical protein NZO16_07635, partial [Deltaproteobacteria bacterium]|nr:hypothetical protein [Deltaproteobacteria bacterium]